MKNKSLIIGMILVSTIVVLALLAPALTTNLPDTVDLVHRLEGPTRQYPLGTDQMGRCLYSRILHGARVSILTAIVSILLTSTIGGILGILAGYFGGKVDQGISWLCDVVLAFPDILLALVIVGTLGPSVLNVVMALAFTSWAGYARITRNLVRRVKQMDYIKLAKVCGSNSSQIMRRHILPNVLSPIITLSIANTGGMILKLSGMSFIGLGAQPPTAEWGMMINEGRRYLETAPRLILWPILAVCLTVFSFNLLGDGLRTKFNPRSEG